LHLVAKRAQKGSRGIVQVGEGWVCIGKIFDNGLVFARRNVLTVGNSGVAGRLVGSRRFGSRCGGDKIKQKKIIPKTAVADAASAPGSGKQASLDPRGAAPFETLKSLKPSSIGRYTGFVSTHAGGRG